MFKKKGKNQQTPAPQPTPQPNQEPEYTYGEEEWVDGRLVVERSSVVNGVIVSSMIEPPDIYSSISAIKRVKKVKLKHSKSEKQAIEELCNNWDEGGIGELVREPSTSGECHYRAMYKGKDVGLMPSSMVNQVRQCYGLETYEELPEHIPCKIVLRVYDDGGGWSAANIL